MENEGHDSTNRRPALWRRLVAGTLRGVARILRRMRRDPAAAEHTAIPTRWSFRPEFIAPYEEVIGLFTDIDARPYRPDDHWTQVLERLHAVAERPYQAFEYGDGLWIQRTPDIEEPLVVSGRPGDRSFCLMTATSEFEWTGIGWESID